VRKPSSATRVIVITSKGPGIMAPERATMKEVEKRDKLRSIRLCYHLCPDRDHSSCQVILPVFAPLRNDMLATVG
ncbi:MAG: hypothetical protein N3E40_07770, partial [Dehalococcoidia bacterium]|nr:hypothetical protein [Dehalococcoidia bacterium]